MNFPANLTLVGIDPFLTEEQALEVQQALEREQHIIDSLDAEIAHAHAALASLRRRRNESQKAISMNSIPSESQVSTIRSNISEHGRRLEQLEKEIIEAEEARDLLEQQQLVAQTESSEFSREQLTNEREQHQGRITHLVVQRDQVQTDIEALQAVISPIRRLPLEILSEIFVECFPKIKFTRPSAHEPPLLLAQICRRWRHVAISTPKIWSAILITVTEHCHPDLSLLQTFIDRSAMHPLSFRIKEELDADAASSMHEAAFELLWSAHARWRDVQLDYKDWRTNSSLGRITETPLLLETLSLKREYWNADALEPLSHLFAAPHLRKIIWFGVLKNHPNPAEIMPLELLQKLNLDNPLTKAQFMQNLRRASLSPRLVSWTLSVFLASPVGINTLQIEDESESPSARLTFPHLTLLDITTDTADEQIFDILVLPSLEVLRISSLMDLGRVDNNNNNNTRFWSTSAFRDLHLRSRFLLNELDLSGTDIEPGELVQVLVLFSHSLQTLNLSNDHSEHACVDDNMLQRLTLVPGRRQQPLCSKLRYIKFWGCMLSTDGFVSDMLESRWGIEEGCGGCVRLRVVLIMFKDDKLHKVDHARLKVLNKKEIGLTVIKRALVPDPRTDVT